MADWLGAGGRWLRGLLSRGGQQAPTLPGTETLSTGEQAVLAVEELLGATVARPPNGDALAALEGLAMSGARVAAWVGDAELADARVALTEAAERHIPLVIHAGLDRGHEAYHQLADGGAFLAFARDPQHAIELTLVARVLAERALVPGVVAMDGPDTARGIARLTLPDAEAIERVVGNAGDRVDTPTEAQTLLFGAERRRVPRWFDPDRPTAHGVPRTGAELAAARVAQRAFFTSSVARLADEAIATVGELTGVTGSRLHGHRLEDARHVLVVQGAVYEPARQVADLFRKRERAKVGVLAVDWLRPFPTDAIRDALAKAKSVTVLERVELPMAGDPPLMREIRTAASSKDLRLVSATYGLGGVPTTAAELLAVCRNMVEGERDHVHLGIAPPSVGSEFPKREVLLQTLSRTAPELDQDVAAAGEPIDLRPEGARTVALHVLSPEPPSATQHALASALAEAAGPHVHGRIVERTLGIWRIEVTVCSEPIADPGGGVPADVVLVPDTTLPADVDPPADLAEGATLVFRYDGDPEQLWEQLPHLWRAAIRSRGLRVLLVPSDDPNDGALVETAASLFGEQDERALVELDWRSIDEPAVPRAPELPMAVRRLASGEATYDSVPRFWGEIVEPRRAGEHAEAVPDPRLALGAVPPSTAGFFDASQGRARMPDVDAERCSGCGDCWTDCPDAAIGPVAIGTEALLNAAADRAAPPGPKDPVAGKLRRAHRQLATRVDGQLAKSGARTLEPDLLRESYQWLLDKMGVGEDERPAMDEAFEATLSALSPIRPSATPALFHDRHKKEKGSGELLVLAIDPHACQGCGICTAVCPENAIARVPQNAERLDAMRAGWSVWEDLPDTPGASIARAAEDEHVGPLPAALLSRHCLLSTVGGTRGEPGSGQRIAVRQATAVIEYQMQRRVQEHVAQVDELVDKLQHAVRDAIASAVSTDDLDHLDEALRGVPDRTANVSQMVSRLEELGERDHIDVRRTRRLLRAAKELQQLRWSLLEGPQGQGRARYGLVVAGDSVADWAARFARNPFQVPVAVDRHGDGSALATGLVQGLLERRVEDARAIRWAELLLENPSDLPVREEAIAELGWRDLTEDERALCPPVLLAASTDAFAPRGFAGLTELLDAELPTKVLLLDPRDPLERAPDASLLALAHRHGFVSSMSIAHHEHLFDGVTGALGFSGPALLHVHAPSPRLEQLPTEQSVERARKAVDSRVQPLLRYDPRADGVFGTRLSLEGNPAVDDEWVTDADGNALQPEAWAAESPRVAETDVSEWAAERATGWRTLQELAGIVTPFTERVREQVEQEVAEQHQSELAALRAEQQAELQRLRDSQTQEQAARLRERLLTLAGYSPPPGGNGGGRAP